MSLTEEQKLRMEHNRLAALKRREEKQKERNQSNLLISNASNQSNNKINNQINNKSGYSINRGIQSLNVQQQNSTSRLNQTTTNNSNANYLGNKSNANNSNSTSMTNIMPYNQQQQNNFITPAKRPTTDQNNLNDKRMKTSDQVKSPYEQIMGKPKIILPIEFKLLNNREFFIDFKYNQQFINEIKKINVRFDFKKKIWVLKLENYKTDLEKLKLIKIERTEIKFGEGFPDHVLSTLADTLKYDEMKIRLEDNQFLNASSTNMLERLFPYQKEGVKFGVRREGIFK